MQFHSIIKWQKEGIQSGKWIRRRIQEEAKEIAKDGQGKSFINCKASLFSIFK